MIYLQKLFYLQMSDSMITIEARNSITFSLFKFFKKHFNANGILVVVGLLKIHPTFFIMHSISVFNSMYFIFFELSLKKIVFLMYLYYYDWVLFHCVCFCTKEILLFKFWKEDMKTKLSDITTNLINFYHNYCSNSKTHILKYRYVKKKKFPHSAISVLIVGM